MGSYIKVWKLYTLINPVVFSLLEIVGFDKCDKEKHLWCLPQHILLKVDSEHKQTVAINYVYITDCHADLPALHILNPKLSKLF